MGAGNLLDNSQGGKNTPFQFNLLQIMGLVANSTAGSATEATLQLVLTALQNGQDYEAKLVTDSDTPSVTWLEVRIYNTQSGTWDPPVYYPAGSTTPGVPVFPIIYIDPTTILATIASNTTNLDVALSTRGTETTQLSVDANLTLLNTKLNTLGQKVSASSTPVVLSTEQETIFTNILNNLSTTSLTLTSTSYTDASNHITIAGKNTVMITCVTGVELINGIMRPAGVYTFQPTLNNTVAAITVNADGGQIIIDAL